MSHLNAFKIYRNRFEGMWIKKKSRLYHNLIKKNQACDIYYIN